MRGAKCEVRGARCDRSEVRSCELRPGRTTRALPFFTAEELSEVARFYGARDDAAATPLRRLPGLAAALGAGEILIKDESKRFGLPAFKIAGARYAVATFFTGSSIGMRSELYSGDP